MLFASAEAWCRFSKEVGPLNPGDGPADENGDPLYVGADPMLPLGPAEGAEAPKRLFICWLVDEEAPKFISELVKGAEVCVLPKSGFVGADAVGKLLLKVSKFVVGSDVG